LSTSTFSILQTPPAVAPKDQSHTMLLTKPLLRRLVVRPSLATLRSLSTTPATSVTDLTKSGLDLIAKGQIAPAFGHLQAAVEAVRFAFDMFANTKARRILRLPVTVVVIRMWLTHCLLGWR
jgi:hypothetical protein